MSIGKGRPVPESKIPLILEQHFSSPVAQPAAIPPLPTEARQPEAPLDMLAYVLSRASERVGQLAQYADDARIAGLTCEHFFDAVRAAPGLPR